jgi:protoporphyrinogen oxidase
VLVLEREAEVGGLCRSLREQGFTFDLTGHLLHLRDPSIRGWVTGLLPGGWELLQRSAWILSHGVLTPYPYQVNTAALPLPCASSACSASSRHCATPSAAACPCRRPPRSRRACLPRRRARGRAGEPSFLDWVLDNFGAGFAKHFFLPYNTKLWRRELSEITGDWVSWSIPRPELADVLRGALAGNERRFGYNPEFLYPRAGGIDALPRAIAAGLAPGVVRTGCAIAALDAGRRTVTLEGGERLDAEAVLTSLPLPALARLTSDLPAALRASAEGLRHVSVRVVNLGVRGAPAHPGAQWIYFPEPDAPFHRIGLPAALTPAMAPAGHHSLVAEISHRPESPPGREESVEQTVAALLRCGLLASRADVVLTRVVEIPEAYVVFDRERRAVLPRLLRWFVERRVVPMGRYGAWDYLAMEDSLRTRPRRGGLAGGRSDVSRADASRRPVPVVHVITQLELGGAQQNTLDTVRRIDRERFRPQLVCGPGGLLDEEARRLADVPVHFPARARAAGAPAARPRSDAADCGAAQAARGGRAGDRAHATAARPAWWAGGRPRSRGPGPVVHSLHGYGPTRH